MNQKIIRRNLLDSLIEHLPKKEISLIIGPRQAGKTTLMKMALEHLNRIGERSLFLDLDFEADNQHFVSQNALLKKIKLEFGDSRGFVFIDEIQRKEDAGAFLKGIYDQDLPYKFIVSGSGSVELKEKVHESLAGRKRLFELFPVSLFEFADFKTDYRYSGRLAEYFAVERSRADDLLEQYLVFGGYPRVVLAETFQEKLNELNEIYRSYIERDLAYLLKIEKLDTFSELIKVLAGQIGRLTNHSELSNTLNLSLPTIKNYLWYAEKTFIIDKVAPFSRNARKEITKSPVYYFYDTGLRNFSAGCLDRLEGSEKGFVFQNLVWQRLKELLPLRDTSLHFWRTTDRAEVDFVVARGKEIIPIEAKYGGLTAPRIERSLRNFIAKYGPERALVINQSFRGETAVGKTRVLFLSHADLFRLEIFDH